MKQLALALSVTSLAISGVLCYGAYVTYQRAQKILDNPEEFVGKVVENQVNKSSEPNPPLPVSSPNAMFSIQREETS